MAWLRHDLIWAQLSELPTGSRLLEIGAGQGAMGTRLAARFDYLGVERDPRSGGVAQERLASLPGGRLVIGEWAELGDVGPVDAICAFEVLEHLEDDLRALREWRDLLSPDGRIVLSVPAHQRRFGPADELVGHYRRYDPDELREVLEEAGYRDVSLHLYGFPLGFALETVRDAIASRRGADSPREERTSASGRFLQPGRLLGLLTWLLTLPFRGIQRLLPEGGPGTGAVVSARVA